MAVSASTKRAVDKLVGIEPANKSQIKSELYEKLKLENRLSAFKAYLRKASSDGLDKKQTVEYIVSKMPGYFSKNELTVGVFNEMLKEGDISFAYGYGEDGNDIMDIMLEDKANEIALRTNDIDVLIGRNTFIESLRAKSAPSNGDGVTVNFSLTKSNGN